jgi:hypothetical protein
MLGWRADGRQLYYISKDDKLMATPVGLDVSFDSGRPSGEVHDD